MDEIRYEIRLNGAWHHEEYDFRAARLYYTNLCEEFPDGHIEMIKVSESMVLEREKD